MRCPDLRDTNKCSVIKVPSFQVVLKAVVSSVLDIQLGRPESCSLQCPRYSMKAVASSVLNTQLGRPESCVDTHCVVLGVQRDLGQLVCRHVCDDN